MNPPSSNTETSIREVDRATPVDEAEAYCADLSERARRGARLMRSISGERKDAWLLSSADRLESEAAAIVAANELDLANAPGFGLTAAQVDRLALDESRIGSMAQALREIAALTDPIGEVIDGSVRPNGLEVTRVRVPLGVVFFIYESRPNVTSDAAAIAIKSGNAILLRGGKEASNTNQFLVRLLQGTLRESGLPVDAIGFVERTDRSLVTNLLRRRDQIDVVIPRGGPGLIRLVGENARMPVIKHESGNCHVYVDAEADLALATNLTINSKCQRPGVCNACESLLVHRDVAPAFLPKVTGELERLGVEIRGDDTVRENCPSAIPVSTEDDTAEYLDKIISIRVVDHLSDAIDHISRFGSGHTDAIVTKSLDRARRFCREVDSAAVMVNASTRFNDGAELGLGAEIGISTDRFHARGPCGIRELTTYKFVCVGEGQVRQ